MEGLGTIDITSRFTSVSVISLSQVYRLFTALYFSPLLWCEIRIEVRSTTQGVTKNTLFSG